jgi:uncharacterized protein (DUF58 family)
MVRPFAWALLAVIALVLSWSTHAAFFAWAGYLMVALLVLGYLTVRLGTGRLGAHRELAVDRIHLGGRVAVKVEVENHSPLPAPWLVAAESLSVGLPVDGVRGRVTALIGTRGFSFTYVLEGARRGYHEVGPTVLHTGDLFGLFPRRLERGGSSWLTVFPKVLPLQHPYLASRRPAGEVRARQRVLEDPTQVVGIRPYHHGDGLRRVHWRATAHTGKLQSKLFEITAQREVTLLLNLRRADYPASPDDAGFVAELAIMATASIAQYLLQGTQRVGLLALARDPAGMGGEASVSVAPGRGPGHLIALLSALGRVELGRTESLPEVLSRQRERFAWGSMVVIVTPRLDDEVLLALVNLRTSGYGVKLIRVGRPTGAPGLDLGAMGLNAVQVQSEEDIRGLDL